MTWKQYHFSCIFYVQLFLCEDINLESRDKSNTTNDGQFKLSLCRQALHVSVSFVVQVSVHHTAVIKSFSTVFQEQQHHNENGCFSLLLFQKGLQEMEREFKIQSQVPAFQHHHKIMDLTNLHKCTPLGIWKESVACPSGLKILPMPEISLAARTNQIWPGGLRPKRNPAVGKVKI